MSADVCLSFVKTTFLRTQRGLSFTTHTAFTRPAIVVQQETGEEFGKHNHAQRLSYALRKRVPEHSVQPSQKDLRNER